jgi:hypothetical protein
MTGTCAQSSTRWSASWTFSDVVVIAHGAEFGKPQPEVPPQVVAEFFAGIRVDRTFDQTLVAARSWKPDLIAGEHYDFVGPLLAAELGVPAAVLGTAPPFGAEFDAPAFHGAAPKRSPQQCPTSSRTHRTRPRRSGSPPKSQNLPRPKTSPRCSGPQ